MTKAFTIDGQSLAGIVPGRELWVYEGILDFSRFPRALTVHYSVLRIHCNTIPNIPLNFPNITNCIIRYMMISYSSTYSFFTKIDVLIKQKIGCYFISN